VNVVFVARCDYSLLTENMASAFEQLGHDVSVFDFKRYRIQDKYLSKNFSLKRLKSHLRKSRPDMVFVVAPMFLSTTILEEIGNYRRKYGGLLVGWIGDVYELNDENNRKCSHFDRLYVTDTHLLTYTDVDVGSYLPLATNPGLFSPNHGVRDLNCSFVASRTDNRSNFLNNVTCPVDVFGPGWKVESQKDTSHRFSLGGISLKATAGIYSRSKLVVNLKNADNVVNGLNQRSFDPCASGAVLLHDYVDDLDRHFDLEKEIVVFRDIDEFEDCYDRLLADSEYANRIAINGYRRVLNEHTYLHRARSVIQDLGASCN
jgi:spore maturation protein CgeB